MGSEVDESVRALLEGDLEDYPRRTEGLDERGWNEFGELVGAAFQRAVKQRFATAADPGIGTFVGAACAVYESSPIAADPVSGEALVRSALGDDSGVAEVLERYDEPDLARIELVLLRKLIADSQLSGDAFDAFLAETGTEAEPWSGRSAAARPGAAGTDQAAAPDRADEVVEAHGEHAAGGTVGGTGTPEPGPAESARTARTGDSAGSAEGDEAAAASG